MAAREKLGDVMTDADFEKALDELREQDESGEVGELLKMMNENRMISWEEAEQILGGSNYNEPVKSSLPAQTRPSEPDNDTDVDSAILKLVQDDPSLKEINLNNMKRTPIPQVKRLVEAIRDNTHLEKLSLANMGLYDGNLEPLIEVIENNESLRSVNLETNYLSGDFFVRLFKAAMKNQTLEEVKAVNQGVSFATVAEKEIIESIFENKGLIKVSINLRLPEGRHKIENAMLRNGEIRRILRRQAAAKAQEEAAKKKTEEEVKQPNGVSAVPAAKTKTSDIKPKAADAKPKATDVKPKATDAKPKTADVKPKDTKPKATDVKTSDTKPTASDVKPKAKTVENDEKAVVEGPSTEKAEKKPIKKTKKTVPKKDTGTEEKKTEVVKKEAPAAKDTTAEAQSAAKPSDSQETSTAKPKATTAKKAAAAAASAATEKAPAKVEPKATKPEAAGTKPKDAAPAAKPAPKVTPKTAPKTTPKAGTGKKIDEPMAVYPRKKQLQ